MGIPILLGLITAGLSVFNPMLLVLVPLAFMLVALTPRKPLLVVISVALLYATFTGKVDGVLWYYARGWSLMLAAWFVITIVFMQNASTITRGITTIAASLASVAVMFGINRAGWYSLDIEMSQMLRNASMDIAKYWEKQLEGKTFATAMNQSIDRFTSFQVAVYPALTAIASLSALGLAWWLYRRITIRDAQPLGRLRDFKFSDELVWVVVIGAALVVLPLQGVADRAGANLLIFMAALYAVRGLAVIVALFGAPTLFGAFFGALIFVMLYPIVMATTLMVGLTDTWLDLRARGQKSEKH